MWDLILIAIETYSQSPSAVLVTLVLATLSITFSLLQWSSHRTSKHLPPGPRGIPILGNISELSGPVDKWITFTTLKSKYGPIVYLTALGQRIVVINTLKSAIDLLDRKALATSRRPRNIVVGIMTNNFMFAFIDPGKIWKRMRRASHDGLRSGVISLFLPSLYKEGVVLSLDLIAQLGTTSPFIASSPADSSEQSRNQKTLEWHKHLQRLVTLTTTRLIYGTDGITEDDVTKLNEYIEMMGKAVLPAAYLVEIFPFLRYFPSRISPWKKMAMNAYDTHADLFNRLFQGTMHSVAQGTDRPSVAKASAERAKFLGLNEEEQYWVAGTLFTGAQSMRGVLAWWLMAMIMHPETQKRAHDEIDEVVGQGRIPTFEDCEKMPYMQAMVKEILRWRPVAPLGLPHETSEDVWYDDKLIPKGTVLLPNVWGINHDPEIFGPDAHLFNPARHLNINTEEIEIGSSYIKEGHVTFGFGRRVCLGKHFANKMILINIVLLLWAADIDGEHGSDGKVVGVDVDGCMDEGVLVRPIPFPCVIRPRFSEAVDLLRKALTELGVRGQ